MKRDIFFSEVTPLNLKQTNSSNVSLLPVISNFQLLITITSTILLPNMKKTCEDVPIFEWVSMMVILFNLHLITAGLEALFKDRPWGTGFSVAHGVFLTLIGGWMALGHYLMFDEGISCAGKQDFWYASAMLGVMDVVGIVMLVISALRIYRKKQ